MSKTILLSAAGSLAALIAVAANAQEVPSTPDAATSAGPAARGSDPAEGQPATPSSTTGAPRAASQPVVVATIYDSQEKKDSYSDNAGAEPRSAYSDGLGSAVVSHRRGMRRQNWHSQSPGD